MDNFNVRVIKSVLSPEQIAVYDLCQNHLALTNLSQKTFTNVWKLVELGVPAKEIVDLLKDVAKYSSNNNK